MNRQLIERIIKINNESCPELVYENPLISKSVADALSRSFVKILNISNQNSKVNNNLRLCVLENIRKMCQFQPEGHITVDDKLTEHLSDLYISDSNSVNEEHSTAKRLDEFLLRRLKSLDINSSFESPINPEVIQALINLNSNGVYLETLLKDTIHWNTGNYKYSNLLKYLWQNNSNDLITPAVMNDISIKMKGDIEILILNVCNDILVDRNIIVRDAFISNTSIVDLTKKCSVSPECFQMCSNILNCIFILTNFDSQMQKLVTVFIEHVKHFCPQVTFSVLYPIHLSNIVLLLDFKTDLLMSPLREKYVLPAVEYLHKLHNESENDLILLLSHFPQWFDIYFNHKNISTNISM